MGLGHFGPQLPRLVIKGIGKDSGKTEEQRKIGGEGKQQEETLSKSGGGVNKGKREGKGWEKRRGH